MQVSISPIVDGNAAIGAVIIMEDITRLKAVEKTNVKTLIAMEIEIAERKRAEASLRRREAFLHLISTISTNFIHLSCNQIDEKINHALQQIGEFAGADRSYVFMFSKDATTVDNTHEWCAGGIEPEIKNLQGINLDAQLPWFGKILRQREFFCVARTAALPPEAADEKAHFLAQGIQSLVVVPMVCEESLLGFVGFDSVRGKKEWSPEVVALLKIVGEMLANALERKKAENALRESEERLRVLSQGAFEAVVILRDEKIVYANHQYFKLFGYTSEELTGNDVLSLTVSTPFLDTVENHITAGHPGPCEVVELTKKGEEIPLEMRFRQMTVEGNLQGWDSSLTVPLERRRPLGGHGGRLSL